MEILKKYNIEDILFVDIETAHSDNNFNEESPLYEAWHYDQMKNVEEEKDLIGLYYEKAPLFAEYGKIVCITVGAVRNNQIILKSFHGEEKELLEDFNSSVSKFSNNKTWLSGHNIIDFDLPFIMKRCFVNGLSPHRLFDTSFLKPWEVKTFDTALLWKGTGWKKQSLISVLAAMGLPSPKDDISGKDVGKIFYEGGIDRIVKYCEKDVISVINLVLKLRGDDVIEIGEQVEPESKGILDYLYEGGQYTKKIEAQLKSVLSILDKKDKEKAIEILNTLPTKAKGKETFITKKHIKEL